MDALRYECLEHDCGAVITAAGEDALIVAVNEHVGAEHRSLELEEVILANAVPIECEEATIDSEDASA